MGASSERLIWGAEECRLVLGWRLPTAQLRRRVSSLERHGNKKLKIREKWATSLVRKSRAESQPKPSRSQVLFGDAVGTVELVQNFQQPGPNLFQNAQAPHQNHQGVGQEGIIRNMGRKDRKLESFKKLLKWRKNKIKKLMMELKISDDYLIILLRT